MNIFTSTCRKFTAGAIYASLAFATHTASFAVNAETQMERGQHQLPHIGKPHQLDTLQKKFEQRLKPWHRDTFEWLTLVVELTDPKEPAPPTRNDHASIGIFGLRGVNFESRVAEFYLLLEEKHTGHGHASEIVASMQRYMFFNLNYHKICAICSVSNTNAQQALENNGFTKEGLLRQNSYINEQFVDDYYYGMLIEEASG